MHSAPKCPPPSAHHISLNCFIILSGFPHCHNNVICPKASFRPQLNFGPTGISVQILLIFDPIARYHCPIVNKVTVGSTMKKKLAYTVCSRNSLLNFALVRKINQKLKLFPQTWLGFLIGFPYCHSNEISSKVSNRLQVKGQ